MKNEVLILSWRHEEQIAHIHGWDFSHIQDRYAEEDDLPWDYRQVIETYLTKEARLLDLDTGGGEFLLSLEHPRRQMAATEEYPPNVALCRERLLPLGVDFRPASAMGPLPFPAESFDMALNRHADLCPREISRVLKKGGVFALNDEMKPRMYGDMEAFAQKLRDMGYEDVRLIDTAKEIFGSHHRAAMMMLGESRMLVGKK